MVVVGYNFGAVFASGSLAVDCASLNGQPCSRQ